MRPTLSLHSIRNALLSLCSTSRSSVSRSTEKYDRGEKFEHYKNLPSLRQYVLVSHQDRGVEVWTRDAGDGWTSILARDGDVADLASIAARLDVSELYEAAAEPSA